MCDAHLLSIPGAVINDRNLGPLFGETYRKAVTIGNAEKGFKACGIETFNSLVFDDSNYAPSLTAERINADEDFSSDDDLQLANLMNKERRSRLSNYENPQPGPNGLE
ncbi:hypothetical protein ILUMI_14507 [Ignelater luminosus]|uniref:Uncharacterized protein n=1 Tax=Ignelater luminosus TaxID=2038154 RepID=A0A8K0CU38_IGNLU|nr:hypothetical protein ILUMI_14507 [Ignelater luminosus]